MRVCRLVPPAGSSLTWRVTGRSLAGSADSRDSAWTDLLGPGERFFFSSGRGALAFLLGLLRDTGWAGAPVAIPGYTCYSVAAAAVRTGCRIRLCDISPDDLTLDLDQLQSWCREAPHVIIAASLLGVPCNVADLERLCADTGSLLIDDAAQILGARPAGRPAGSFGAAGVFSTGRGKIISGFQGGILTVRDRRIAAAARQRYDSLPVQSLPESIAALAQFFLSPLLQHPRVFWLPAAIPALGIGRTVFDPGFPVGRLRRVSKRVLGAAVPDVVAANLGRKQVALRWIQCLGGLPVRFLTSDDAVHPRLGLVLADRPTAERCVEAARQAGVMASRMYPRVLADLPQLRDHLMTADGIPGARRLCDGLVTLPTQRSLTAADMVCVCDRWRGLLA